MSGPATDKPRIVMIGVGNLMEVIWPAIEPVVGGRDAADRLLGVTMDEADLPRKRELFGFEVTLGGNLEALRRNRPDIIMFSPPPTVAPELIETVLRPYVAECRADGRPLPELYAYPPVPPGRAYHEALGEDVPVVNIIPNNVTDIAGETVVDEGYYVCTFPSPWPADRVAMLQRIFGAQGAYVELEPDRLIPMLGGAATIFGLWHATPAIADILAAARDEPEGDHRAVARHLRSTAAALSGLEPAPEAGDPLPAGERAVLDRVIRAWHGAISSYYPAVGIGEPAASTLIGRGFDLILHTCEAETREVLHELAVGAATKGGVLERAIASIDADLLPLIRSGIADGPDEGWETRLQAAVGETAHTVRRHGETLAG